MNVAVQSTAAFQVRLYNNEDIRLIWLTHSNPPILLAYTIYGRIGTTQGRFVRPDKPITVEFKEDLPTDAQLETLRVIHQNLAQRFDVRTAMFCHALMPFSEEIRSGPAAPIEEQPPALGGRVPRLFRPGIP
jgi:hypothetical protein